MPDFGPLPSSDGANAGGQAGAAIGKQVGEAEKHSSALLESAKSGGFRVSENAAQPLLSAIQEAHNDLAIIIQDAHRLADDPKLGSSPYAQQVAKHVRESGDGPQGILPTLQTLLNVIGRSEQALVAAMKNYRENEDQQQSTFKQ